MNDPNPSHAASHEGGAASVEPKKRGSVGRIIEWVLIAVFGLIVANEAYSKFSYDATLKSFNDLFDDAAKVGNNATIGEFDALVKGMPSRIETPSPRDENSVRVDYRWRSLFKPYHIVVSGTKDETGKLAITNLDTNVPLEVPGEPTEIGETTGSEGTPTGGSSPMGGHGGGGHGGGAGAQAGGPPRPGPMADGPGSNTNGDAASRPELETPETDDDADDELNDEVGSSEDRDNQPESENPEQP